MPRLPELVAGDCRETMKAFALMGEMFDACVTDPPYDLVSIVKRFGGKNAAPARPGTDGAFVRQSKGFMGKQWDGTGIAFDPATWRAAFDVLKPGAHLVAFGSDRTYHRMVCAIEDAGFEVRRTLMWIFGTGMPKSHDQSKAIDKTGNDLLAAALGGVGTDLKPAFEPIVLARKPIEGTVARNILAHGTGGLNIDACRIHAEDAPEGRLRHSGGKTYTPVPDSDPTCKIFGRLRPDVTPPSPAGRFPANILHDGSDEVRSAFPVTKSGAGRNIKRADKGNRSAALSGGDSRPPGTENVVHGDEGSAARFFYSTKASKADRAGSTHPTIKPLALMRWLCRLVTPPGGRILDPFAGSGTTLQAAYECGFDAIGCEMEPDYCVDIINRLAAL